MKEITNYKWGKSYIISKTPDMAVEKMMEDIFNHHDIPQDFMNSVAERIYLWDKTIINTDDADSFINSLIENGFLIESGRYN